MQFLRESKGGQKTSILPLALALASPKTFFFFFLSSKKLKIEIEAEVLLKEIMTCEDEVEDLICPLTGELFDGECTS